MKLNKFRTAVLATAMAVIGTVGAFAQKPEGKGCPDFRGPHGPGPMPFNFAEKQIMGTISNVNPDTGIIVLTDADGKSKKIHVNPLTNITVIEPRKAPPKDKKADKKDKKNDMPPPFFFNKIGIDRLKAGHWVTVNKFNTDTETIEAMNINVHNFRELEPKIDTSNAK
ncbi:MAG: hypothetical protein KBS64_03425 [Treponema sp.]|nr:hypothetical protein [Candidatus Treponema equi]